jgi:DNA polymerase III epsilon subunit family exonuclease
MRPGIDAASVLPEGLLIETEDRAERGIRISLPPRKPGTPPAYRLGYAEAERLRWLRGRRRFGEGWADPGPGAGSPGDDIRSLDYAIVDLETTGGSAWQGHRVTEVCAIRIRGDGRFVEEYTTLVNPDRSIPPFITRLTRITPAMTASAPRFREVAEDVRRIVSGAVFVAHNAPFDWRFLSTELEWAGAGPLRGRVLCTVRLARRLVPEVSRRSLDALSWYFGIENVARHRAFGDARATTEIFRRLLDRLDEMEIRRWKDVEALISRRAPRRKRRASPEPVKDF